MLTLASDFGSPYPAAMKGAVRRRCDAELIDLTHGLPRGDPRAGAFWLRFLLPEFPPAVHCAVVDPGVGTDRDAVVLRANGHAVVAPDNGLAVPAARALARGGRAGRRPEPSAESGASRSPGASDDAGDAGDAAAPGSADGLPEGIDAFRIRVADPDSATFHGRDVFAPAAADAHRAGVGALETVDRFEPVESVVGRRLPAPAVERDGGTVRIDGEVLAVDDFGNVITSVPGDLLPDGPVTVNGERVPVARTFAAVDPGDRLVTVGSHGHAECDVSDGRGDEAFGLAPGDRVRIVG